MLKEIQIKNFAIIDDINVKFKKGLNILSGETGAGKTLVIEAINMLLGERADSELIRENEDKLYVQGYFNLSGSKKSVQFLINENLAGKKDDFTDIVITREVNREGKNRSFINGIFTQAATLKKFGKCFLDLHGQHDHQYLLEPGTHIDIIDSFGADAIQSLKEDYINIFNQFKKSVSNLDKLLELKSGKERKLDELRFRLNEIENLGLKDGEELELENEKNVLKNYEKVFNLCTNTMNILNADENNLSSIIDYSNILQKNINDLMQIDKNFERFSPELGMLVPLLVEINEYIKTYINNIEYSPEKLDRIQERLFKISEIKRKYSMDTAELCIYAEKLKRDIAGFENIDFEIEQNQADCNFKKKLLTEIAFKLSEQRKKIICIFEKRIKEQLAELNFKSPAFTVKNEYIPGTGQLKDIEVNDKNVSPSGNGIDSIEFFVSMNPGENVKPLKKIASGGEISRIMLAIKSITGGMDDIVTMVFDEIDAGIGGQTAIVVGKKLFKISKMCQVICITHLPQIAAFADFNYYIDKLIDKERTKIKITELDQQKRVIEISRMLSGLKYSDISQKHALELLDKASQFKNEEQEEVKIFGN